MADQLSLIPDPRSMIHGSAGRMEHFGPWPAPDGYYSHYVVWRTCLVMELAEWIALRDRSG